MAHVWQLNSSNVISQLTDVPYSAGTLQTTVPGQSVTLLVIPPRQTLNLLAGAPRTDGQFEFWVQGEIGGSFVLQSSTNLPSWTPASTNTFARSAIPFPIASRAARGNFTGRFRPRFKTLRALSSLKL